jgi:undecaprenyl-phosphate 4-deoxy-4-formamido-L-arabinose transferase
MGCPELSVVIPVYRSAAMLETLVQRLVVVLDRIGCDYEAVFVDDGSPDQSWDVLQRLQATYPKRIVAIQLMRNFGQHNALMCGFRHSRGQFIVTMDDDLQNPPEEIPKLVDAITRSGLDLVYGRYAEKKHHSWRNLGSFIVNSFYRVVFKTRRSVTAFRIIRRELLESIFPYTLNFTFLDGLLAWNTQRIGEVPVEHHPRREGRSGYSVAKLLLLALNLFTNFSLLPLQLVSAVGLSVSFCGILGALYFLVRYLAADIGVPGYASTIVAVLMLGGVQLLSLGIIGEYLGRLHLNVNRKPQYVERHVLRQGTSPVAEARSAEVDSVAPVGPRVAVRRNEAGPARTS